jgi:hypothetical protein
VDEVVWKFALAGLSVVGAIVVATVPRWSEARERRRTRYAEAVEALIAWAEFPYRIARRIGDDPQTLADLTKLGHELQERLTFVGAWVTAESAMMGNLYRDVVGALRCVVGSASSDAWRRPPIFTADEMNVGNLGIDGEAVAALATRVAMASRVRFGWRRMLGHSNIWRKVFSDPVDPPMTSDDEEPESIMQG